MSHPKHRTEADALIVGAGAAGIFAGRELMQAGMRSITLEARQRIGGRIYTLKSFTKRQPVELGAEFIHGNVITKKLATEYGLTLIAQPTEGGRFYINGKFIQDIDVRRSIEQFRQLIQQLTREDDCPRTLAGVLTHRDATVIFHGTKMTSRLMEQLLKNDLAADPRELDPTALLEPEMTGYHPSSRIAEGYGELLNRASVGQDIRTNVQVQKVEWDPRAVQIFTSRDVFRARYAILTLPIGVLQNEDVEFDPPLPRKTQDAIYALNAGKATKTILEFRRNQASKVFWPEEVPWVATTLDTQLYWPTEQGFDASPNSFLISNLTGGDATKRFNGKNGEGKQVILNQLAHMFKRDPENLRKYLLKGEQLSWHDDRFSKTGYCALNEYGDPDARETLGEPIQDTLIIAGEATRPGDVASVHGAIESGMHAARQIIEWENA